MSGLTAEQKQKIEENRRRALALRGTKQQSSVRNPTPRFPTTSTTRPVTGNHSQPRITQGLPGVRSKSAGLTPVPAKAGWSNGVPPVLSKPQVTHQVGPNSQPSTARNFYAVSSQAQKKSTSPKKSSYYALKYGKKGSGAGVSPTKDGKLKGQCVLCSRTRFLVEVGYCAPLIELFKKMNTKQYDTQTRTWSFDLQEYNPLMSQKRGLSEAVAIEPLPPFAIRAFLSSTSSTQNAQKDAPVDLSSVDEQLLDQLRPFQRRGVEFVVARDGRALIADDMGLGKTIQAICVAAFYRKEWPLLIIVPSSLRFAWREQILRFLPGVDPQEINVVVTGKDSCTSGLINILSYDLMVRLGKELLNKRFKIIIMDESHFLKNIKTARTKTAMPLLKNASRVLLLSGTPALSRPSELYAQVSAVQPHVFSKFHDFGVRYCNAKQMPWGWDYTGSSHLQELQLILEEKVMIRRLKKDVLAELPSKIRQMIVLDASAVKINKSMKASHKQVDKAKGTERRGALLSYFNDTAEAKIPAVRGYILDLLESGSKILVFAHHRSVLDALEEAVHGSYKSIRIDGRTSAEQRNFFCNKFQANDDVQVALLSITAANAGLNLTAAKVVVFAELFWNPGILMQAEDRAHRIGQDDSVSVHYLVATGTADDFIWPLVQQKLTVLGKAGLSKEDFAEADTKHIQDPLQRDILSFFQESFFEDDLPEDIPGGTDGEKTDAQLEQSSEDSGKSGTLLQHFKPVSQPGDENVAEECTSSDWTSKDPEPANHRAGNEMEDADWLDNDDDFAGVCDDAETDPDEPRPKKPKLQ